jgi:hypothetical protein
VDVAMPCACVETEALHYEQIVAGTDFFIGLQYPGLVGDARARAVAKNAFSKWRKKAAKPEVGADAMTAEMLSGLMEEVAADAGLEAEIRDLGMDLPTIMASLLRQTKADEVLATAEVAATAANRKSTRISVRGDTPGPGADIRVAAAGAAAEDQAATAEEAAAPAEEVPVPVGEPEAELPK